MLINHTPLDDMFEIENYLLDMRFRFRTDGREKLEAEEMVNKARRVIAYFKERQGND